VPDHSLGLTRPPLLVREGWATQKREKLEAEKLKK
jgi:hypothetical protein